MYHNGKIWSDREIREFIDAFNSGLSYQDLGELFGMRHAQVSNFLTKLRKSTYDVPHRHQRMRLPQVRKSDRPGIRFVYKNGVNSTTWGDSDYIDQLAKKLKNEGHTVTHI